MRQLDRFAFENRISRSLQRRSKFHCHARCLHGEKPKIEERVQVAAKENPIRCDSQDLTLQAILSNGVATVRQTLSRVFSAMGAERAKKGRKLVLRPGYVNCLRMKPERITPPRGKVMTGQ